MKKKKLKVIFPIILLIIIILLLVIVIINKYLNYKYENEEIFEVENRVDKIEKSQKYNNEYYEINAWIKVQGTNIDIPVIAYLDTDV